MPEMTPHSSSSGADPADPTSSQDTPTPSRLQDISTIEDRDVFVHEYNKLAKEQGIHLLLPETHEGDHGSNHRHKHGWFSRAFSRRPSSPSAAAAGQSEKGSRHKRSTSDVAASVAQPKKSLPVDQGLQGLARLCGKSLLCLPPEYAPGSLVLPTCLAATAQYLAQHGPGTSGLFRIPGSIRTVNMLYDYYCGEHEGAARTPDLPSHLHLGVHDVASAFKRFLAGLPGGILGSLPLFEALAAVQSQLQEDAGSGRPRAKLVALAIGTLESQSRRQLICAVFGLLAMLGRAAEAASQEGAPRGGPRPPSDLMGYRALSIIFGPLLVGDLVDSYERICVANAVAEMVLMDWRDTARYMKALGVLSRRPRASTSEPPPPGGLRWDTPQPPPRLSSRGKTDVVLPSPPLWLAEASTDAAGHRGSRLFARDRPPVTPSPAWSVPRDASSPLHAKDQDWHDLGPRVALRSKGIRLVQPDTPDSETHAPDLGPMGGTRARAECTPQESRVAYKPASGAVKAMAAMFDNAARNSVAIPLPASPVRSAYARGPSPAKSAKPPPSEATRPGPDPSRSSPGGSPRPSSASSRASQQHLRRIASLCSQVEALERQLAVKTEECEQLRRQLRDKENRRDADPLLRARLREARRECQFWKQRAAEAAGQVLPPGAAAPETPPGPDRRSPAGPRPAPGRGGGLAASSSSSPPEWLAATPRPLRRAADHRVGDAGAPLDCRSAYSGGTPGGKAV